MGVHTKKCYRKGSTFFVFCKSPYGVLCECSEGELSPEIPRKFPGYQFEPGLNGVSGPRKSTVTVLPNELIRVPLML